MKQPEGKTDDPAGQSAFSRALHSIRSRYSLSTVVDNDNAILKTISILLKALGLNPRVACDRREALAVMRRHAQRLRAIVLDAHLGGIDTVRLLGAFRVGAPNVPLIVSSGSPEEEIREMFSAHPYDAFLAKPYTLDELKRTISSTMA